MRSKLVPQCTECMRSYAFGILREARPALGGLEHIRGKKKSTRGPLNIPVRLLKDHPGFGVKGAIVPIPAGRMRNYFFPNGIADYVTMEQKRQLKRSGTTIERDFSFGMQLEAEDVETEESIEEEIAPVRPKRVEVKSISPERAMELFEIFIPQRLDFYRQAILEPGAEPEPEPATEEPRTDLTGVAADLFALRAEARRQAEKEARSKREKAIYGSVSTNDVYEALKARMAQNDESSRVAFDAGAISFTSTDVDAEDSTKIKEVGTFNYTIKMRGAENVVSRTIKIIAQQA